MTTEYPVLRRIGKFIYQSWENRPDTPVWLKGTPVALFYEGTEEIVDLQFQAALAISQGKVAGKDQYNSIERERVESLGVKPIWSPGGFQI
jgi:hypothetical protein